MPENVSNNETHTLKSKMKWLLFRLFAVLLIAMTSFFLHQRWSAPARDVALAPAPKVKNKVPRIETEGSVQMIIKGRLAEVQNCYNTELKKGITRSGNLVVKWLVDAQGRSSQFEQELNELGSAELFDCTTAAIQAWPFPKNRATQIRYTFKMRALEKEKVVVKEYTSLE